MAKKKNGPELITISTAVPPDLAKRIKEAAEADDRTVSNWLRIVVTKALGKK